MGKKMFIEHQISILE